jgi:hypothetical protein
VNIVEKIRDALVDIVEQKLPDYNLSRYVWDYEKNFKSANKNFFAIRPQDASFQSGTCNTITLLQRFEIELGNSFRHAGDTDQSTDKNIMKLYEDHQSLYLEIMRNNFNIGRVQVVGDLDLSSPEVDNDNKVTRIVATYSITYRTE